ncbi:MULTISPECIES: Hint domain-containing protein [unclassified Phyllobacterium]|nr:Hint domain-containing protein [Phyllobacterium sp.]
MTLLNVQLVSNTNQTINSSNASNGDTVNLGLVSNGILTVDGVNVTLTNVAGAGVVTSTTINLVNNANLTVDTALLSVTAGSTFHYNIGAGTNLTILAAPVAASLLNGTTIDFANAAGTGHFTYNPPLLALTLSTPPNIINANTGDKVTVNGAASVTQSGNVVSFLGPSPGLGLPGPTLATYTIPAGATYNFVDSTDTLTFVTPCFVRGTLIATPDGQVAVEWLKTGDIVLSLNKGPVAVTWIGRRTIDPKTLDKPRNDLPVRIRAGAIADNVPQRDLSVSPDHCMFLDGVLVPAKLLINGTTVTQEITLTPVDYYHVELEEHDVIWAEGAQTETYLDLGNKSAFLEPGVIQFTSPKAKQAKACYPLAYWGPAVDQARALIAEREAALGYTTSEAKAS